MLNQVLLVGRIYEKTRKEDNKLIVVLAVPRSYKNKQVEELGWLDAKN